MMDEQTAVCARLRATLAGIERWLGDGPHEPARLQALMADFEADFTMTAPDGSRLDSGGLQAFFEQAAGSRPGLRIALTEMTVLSLGMSEAVAAYYETQTLDDGSGNGRHATALLRRNGANWRWRHLQETLAASWPADQ
ncbi:nuclear transport factor 2 family protein [Chromobacterium sp. IIBBL 290-4]|uniref:nuclear transport factor 2 family protein n=1 Tax=Chromobacterium sp. IIBBL 290-4 TaxID=2953890 RepID=UPI0020B7377E|nr:nuclear transport factor 2 family protein [Chromobacterium sp. IIBBL 290-4]UTH75362.1 DUF4440 domain-containing protein [Chromobacterium sp. IIBBL 290-4]